MHYHGHNMFVLAEGEGEWDGKIVNPSNPQRRDVQMVRANGHMVVQWFQDNPGAWVSSFAVYSITEYITNASRRASTATSHGISA